MERRRVGFRASWMTDEPEEIQIVEAVESLPDELMHLRYKIAQIATFMASTGFSKMRKNERMDLILEYTELNSIESGYTRAVNNQQ